MDEVRFSDNVVTTALPARRNMWEERHIRKGCKLYLVIQL